MDEIIELIDKYWRFDNTQQPMSSWHEKQDLIELLRSKQTGTNTLVMESVLPTFDQILREEFLVNTQNYPAQYHKLFVEKFSRAKRRHEELSGKTAP